eukprot:3153180-Pyramimonas_sp.AAC.1
MEPLPAHRCARPPRDWQSISGDTRACSRMHYHAFCVSDCTPRDARSTRRGLDASSLSALASLSPRQREKTADAKLATLSAVAPVAAPPRRRVWGGSGGPSQKARKSSGL